MIALECVLGRMGNHGLPAFLAHPDQLSQFFFVGSHGDIQLSVNPTHLGQPLFPGPDAYLALDLHQATLALTKNPMGPQAQRIAVLFANFYAPHPGVFGMMFDRGFATWDDPNTAPILTNMPREGCAVFLGGIASLRSGAQAEQEALFTTVHEMGHLFNLQHVSLPSFMATSQPNAPYPPGAFAFIPPQQGILSQCSKSPFVWPGGLPFAGDNNWSQGAMRPDSNMAEGQFGLELVLGSARHEFWPFEPIELEIEVRVAAGIRRSFFIPDRVDPGYPEFVIWLENPRGERCRYQSPRHYCGVNKRRKIAPDRPFKRDISIFGQAGGYTFSTSGIWRVWAEFQIGNGRRLQSNRIELNVLPRSPAPSYERAFHRLAQAKSAALLYHRLLRPSTQAVVELVEQANDPASEVPVGGIEYALGRALATSSRKRAPRDHTEASEFLKRARDRKDLGATQRRHADRIIEELNDVPSQRRGKRSVMSVWGKTANDEA